MKKLLIVPAICVVLVGCVKFEDDKEIDKASIRHSNDCATKFMTTSEGYKYVIHKYVIVDGNYVHAASCECMNK